MYFKKKLKVPKDKVYSLSNKEMDNILKSRQAKIELDPGFGGVSPDVIQSILKEGSELVSIDFALTAACNFNCEYCYRPENEWGVMKLSYDTLSRTIEDAAELGVRFFILTGGEPLMYSNKVDDKVYKYFDIVDKIRDVYSDKEVNPQIMTFSDVALITPEVAKKLAERKVGLCLKRDSLDHKIQDALVRTDGASIDMERAYQNLFDVGYGKDPSLPISVNQVLQRGKFNTLNGSVKLHYWIKSHGMEHSIIPVHYCGNALDENQEDGLHTLDVKVLYDILAYIDTHEFNDPWKTYSPFVKNKTCNRPGRGVHIRATGDVTSCSESPLLEPYLFGNILEGNLLEMIRSDKFRNFSEDFDQGQGTYVCNSDVCDLHANKLCRGGCATRSAYSKIDPKTGIMIKNENLLAYSENREDPFCPAWIVQAKRQGILKEGLYEKVADEIFATSNLEDSKIKKIKKKILDDFNNL